MSASSLFSLGTKALTASYAALATTGHNISNANVKGYSRQQVELTTAVGQASGAGYFGKGVDVTTVTRAYDSFLTRESATANSLAAMDQSRLTLLNQLESVFPTGEQGVGYAAGQFLNSMVDLSARPSDAATRQVVLARAAEVANRFAAAGSQLDQLQLAVQEDLKADVARINQLAAGIAELNQRIVTAQGVGHAPNDLLDQRDQALADLSAKLQISTVAADDGSVTVFVAGGQTLVMGNRANTMSVIADTSDASRSALGLTDNGFVRRLQSQELGGGEVAGLLRFQNDDLVDARTLIGQMAAALAGAVNQQQALGLDLRDPPGSGMPLFATGAAQALPDAANAVNGAGQFIGQVSLTVTDASQLQASEYALVADPGGAAGVWQLTRLRDGLVRSIASGDVVDGLRIDVGPPAPAAGDRFLLQPVTRAANGMQRVLDDVKGLAAASPLSAASASANTGSASVAALRIVSPSADPQQSASISFTNDSGDYSWELRDRATNALLSSGVGTWSAGTPIALNGFELDLHGAPRTGDAFSVTQTQFPASNNGNALAYSALRDAALVGRTALSGGGIGGGATITDAYAAAMADIGVRVQAADSAAQISGTVATQAEAARSARSGVNLDEEAARLLQYQQSYQAAAKILQVAQSVFDALLDATSR
ncbi:MAG: flagellar hook-associated protein FlgK [Rubrivivax sp.]|nr:flagellar hook-associated protein FlgK [Rubrivivax sp.]